MHWTLGTRVPPGRDGLTGRLGSRRMPAMCGCVGVFYDVVDRASEQSSVHTHVRVRVLSIGLLQSSVAIA